MSDLQFYVVNFSFPDIENQLAAYKQFIEYAEGGYPDDNFEGFEMFARFHMPQNGSGVVICRASGSSALFKHFAPWRAQFGMELDIEPAMGCDEAVAMHKALFAEAEGKES